MLVPVLVQDDGVRHIGETAEVYLPRCRESFDVILNDMRMDARDSARLMVSALPLLRPTGWALMTLKLPRQHSEAVMVSALGILSKVYEISGVRQLFHNRSEVTVALRREA